MRKKKQCQVSELASSTFQAFENYINIFNCGLRRLQTCQGVSSWMDKAPFYMITKLDRELFFTWKRDSKKKHFYPKIHNGKKHKKAGQEFSPWRDYSSGILNKKHIEQCINNGNCYYYTGGKKSKTLVRLDIDAHQGQGREQLALTQKLIVEFLGERNLLPGEVSDRGTDCFFKLHYGITPPDKLGETLKKLGETLTAYCHSHGSTCNVEVQGAPDTKAKYGHLAKLPCWNGWTDAKLERFTGLPERGILWVEGAIATLQEKTVSTTEPVAFTLTEPVKVKQRRTKSCGSISGSIFTPKELENFTSYLHDARTSAYRCMSFRQQVKSRAKLTAMDFCIELVILSKLRAMPNADGTMPHKRIETIWSYLYQKGVVDRAFDCCRHKAIRNTLADLRMVDCEDNRYWFYEDEGKKGRAMKWALAEEYAIDLAIEKEEMRERTSLHEQPFQGSKGFRPKFVYPPDLALATTPSLANLTQSLFDYQSFAYKRQHATSDGSNYYY